MNKSYLKSLNHKLNKKIKNNRFLIGIYTQFVPVLKYFYFKNERLASKGKNISNSQHQSILYFTAQKCASTLLSGILEKLSLEENMVAIRYSNYLPDVDRSAEFRDQSFLKRAFKKKGYYYGAFRSFHPVPNIEDYKVLLVLRDPRDVLTSSYFSTAFNHPIARKDTLEKRAIAKNQDIDTYVLENADFFKKAYQDYTQNILHLDNAIFLKYEDMIEDFEPWLNQLLSHVGLNKNKEAIAEIIRNTSFEVKSENKNNFIRNVKAGDHIRKLKPETIEKLNVIFKDILDKLGY